MTRPRTVTVGALIVVLAIGGCGGGQPSQRPAVARYVKEVNRIEAALAAPLTQLTRLGSRFARNQSVGAGTLSRFLAGADVGAPVARILALRTRLAALPVPPPATRLRALLLALIDAQVHLAHQLGGMVAFLPRFDGALRPLSPAMLRLESSLRQRSAYGYAAVTAVYTRKALALRRFKGVVDRALAALRPLHPPDAFRPDYRAQIGSLRGMSSGARRLASALGNGAPGNVQPLLTAFDHAALSTQGVGVQRAHLAAVRRYDGEIAQLTALSGQAERERLRLANGLT